MSSPLLLVKSSLRAEINKDKTSFYPTFFKTGPGQYAEGDKFLGVTVPRQRKIAKRYYRNIPTQDIEELLQSKWHEERLTALLILMFKYKQASEIEKEQIIALYLKNLSHVNNWDLVDTSAPHLLGDWLLDKDRTILYQLAQSDVLWERRIAIISTLSFIRKNQFEDTIHLSKILLYDEHDLIHKAVGWCLREVGKRNRAMLKEFLDKYAGTMPRIMLGYAIEKFPEAERKNYLKLKSIAA
jgi:3-methyladenine DNA glycosylase AlkD